MASKNKARLADLDMLDDIKQTVDGTVRPQRGKKTSRPRLNPHAQDKKLTFRIPEEVHRQLRMASADKGRPMTEIVVDALIKHLKKYESM